MSTWRRILVVFAKEAVDNARDRRSLLVALIYPLLGPILLGLLISAIVDVVNVQPKQEMVLPVAGMEHAPELVAFLETRGVRLVAAPDDPAAAVRDGAHEGILVIPPGFARQFQANEPASLEVVVNSSRLPGLIAVNRILSVLGAFNQEVWSKRIAERGVDLKVLQPLEIKSVNVAAGSHVGEFLLFMVPPLFIFNLFMGGVYLAMDTTSGERERGSLESLLVNPVARWGLMLGKYLAALLYTLVAVAVQLSAFAAIFNMVETPDLSFTSAMTPAVILGILVMTLPLMMVAVGVQVIIATVTLSYKEAQTYLGLLPLIPAIPGMVMVFAPVQAQGWMMTIPIFSQTLLLGQFVRGEPIAMTNVLLSMSVSGLIAAGLILVAARLYEREKLIFGS